LCCRCGGHDEGLVLPRYHNGHNQRLARGRGRWSAAWERTRRSAVAEASGGAGALGLERRRRRRATSSATGAAGGAAERWRFGGGEGLEWWGPGLGCKIGKLLEQFVFWG
jgi:hypothetical protein